MINGKKEIGIWLQVNYNEIVDEIWTRILQGKINIGIISDDEGKTKEKIVDVIEENLRTRLIELNLDDAIRNLTEELKVDYTGSGYYLFQQLIKAMYEQDCWNYASQTGRRIRAEIAERYHINSQCLERSIRYMIHKLNPEDIKETLCIDTKSRISCRRFMDAVMLYLK